MSRSTDPMLTGNFTQGQSCLVPLPVLHNAQLFFFIPLPSVLLLLIVQSQERTEPFEIKSNRGLVRLNQRLNQATVCPNCWCAHAENFSGESLGSDNSIFMPWRVALAKDTASTTGPQQSKRSKKAERMSRRWQVMLLQ